MTKNFKRLSESLKDDKLVLNWILLAMAIILGSAVRMNFISGTNYPYNDGGLFYVMAEDLLNNKFLLPEFTTYNLRDLPYAYPPLGFYLTALLSKATGVSLLAMMRYLPVGVSIGTIAAFYLLADEVFEDKILSAVSAILFSLLPRTFEWFVMGGGLTRSLGFLFAILAIREIWLLYTGRDNIPVVIRTALFSGLTVLAHPETAFFVIFTAVCFLLYHGISWRKVGRSLYVALGVVLCILPWIISVVSVHGLAPFLSAGGTGHGDWLGPRSLLTLNFGFENGEFLAIYSLMALVAIITSRERLNYFLGILLLAGYIFFPRSGPNFLTIWMVILASEGLRRLLQLTDSSLSKTSDFISSLNAGAKGKVVFAFVTIYALLAGFSYKYVYGKADLYLTSDLVESFEWIEDHTDPEDKILIYPSTAEHRFWWNDYISEWFPALVERENLTTVQGSEWVPEDYEKKVYSYRILRGCPVIGPDCLAEWKEYNKQSFDVLVIDKTDQKPDFVQSFLDDPAYDLYYDSERLIVFQTR